MNKILTAEQWATGEQGVFSGVPNKEYHSSTGLSSSYLKRLATSPAHTRLPVEFSPQAQRSIDIGTLVHGFVLESLSVEQCGFETPPEHFDASGLARKPEGMSFATTDGKKWKQDVEKLGLEIVTRDPQAVLFDRWMESAQARNAKLVDIGQIETARFVEAAIFADPEARIIASRRGPSELSLRVYDADFDVFLKARFDYYDPETGLIWDLKTVGRSVDPDGFAFECDDRGYLIQAAHYLHTADLLGLKSAGFRFVAASTVAPHEVGVYDFGPGHPAWGAVNEHLLELYALNQRCESTNDWPKRAWGPLEIGVPYRSRYAARKGDA